MTGHPRSNSEVRLPLKNEAIGRWGRDRRLIGFSARREMRQFDRFAMSNSLE